MKTNKFIKNKILLVITLLILISLTQSCRCLICDNNDKENPQFNLGKKINSPFDDYAPLIIDDNKLLFTSSKEARPGYIADKDFFGEDLFIAINKNKEWLEAKLIDAPTNTFTNEGTVSQIVLNNNNFTIVAKSHDPNGLGGSDLYLAKYNGRTLSKFENLGAKFNTENWEAHPALSSDGNTLIFASNKPGGIGGSDLYITSKIGNSWRIPKNLGPKINTNSDDISPYIVNSQNGNIILFYSSKSEDNNKLDIYYNFRKKNNDWYDRQLLSVDVNTIYNEAFPCPASDMKSIFFSSDRPGGCGGFDLYSSPLKLKEQCLSIKGKILDKKSKRPILVKANIDIKALNNNEIFSTSTVALPSNKYIINALCSGQYKFHITAEGFLPKDTTININLHQDEITHLLTQVTDTKIRKIFDLRKYNVPFFVTGYYKLNTKDNLSLLRKRINSDLKKATYIENPKAKYDKYANKIESIFNDSIYSFVSDSLLPAFESKMDKAIIFEIFGYTDPRIFTSIYPAYLENDVSFEDLKVIRGSKMNNKTLANLRAYYTMIYLDNMLIRDHKYLELKNSGKIKYKIEGKGIDTENKNQDSKRRVQIKIWKETLNIE